MRESPNKFGFTQVDHVTFDLILPTLSPAAQITFLRIYRQTVGWKKPGDRISLSQFRRLTGYKHNKTISDAITELEDKKLVAVVREKRRINTYFINFETVETYSKNEQASSKNEQDA